MLHALIVGAGPTGLTLAISLLRMGLSCRVIDRARGPATTSRASDCHARTMEILDDLGVAPGVVQCAHVVDVIRVYAKGVPVTRIPWEPPDSPYPWNYILPQARLEGLLRQRLGQLGGRVEWGVTFASLQQHEHHVTSIVEGAAPIDSKWVIGCDGAHSGVRRATGIPFEGMRYQQLYYLGDVQVANEIPRHAAHLSLDPRGVTLIMPLGGAPCWRVFTDVSSLRADDGTLPPPSLEFFQTLLAERMPRQLGFDVTDLAWSSTFTLEKRQAQNYRQGRVFLAGDAAHVFSPFGGQGMNTGIQDAYNLAWKLAAVEHGILQPQLLDTYELERSPVAEEISARVHSNTRFLTLKNPIICALRNAGMRLALKSRRFARAIADKTAQVSLNYRGLSALAAHHDALRSPRAGDRAPDAPLPAGAHLLLLFGGRSNDQSDLAQASACVHQYLNAHVRSVTIDDGTAPALRQRYNVRGATVVLIRPDGYIGFRAPARKHRALQRYMARNYLS